MNKREFMYTIEKALEGYSEDEKNDILYDYEEHFRIGDENGKSEKEIIEELGDPISIANQYRRTEQKHEYVMMESRERNIAVTVIAAIALLFLNFIIIGPFIGLIGALITIGMLYIFKFAYKFIVKYISWNIKMIRG